jgi:hypothetical protein
VRAVASPALLDERFRGDDLDRSVWLPAYLPHWSSRSAAAATYAVRAGELHLSIPVDQPLWCADLHPEPLRVSAIQSGAWSGPVGSTAGQGAFREGLRVREAQEPFTGYAPHHGRVEVRMRATISPRSMVAFWMMGREDRPERSGEICVAEIFGDAVGPGWAEVGMGIKAFRDPDLRQAFATERLAIDVAERHTYGVEWRRSSVAFEVDGRVVRQLDQAPDYPLQLMIAVFDLPAKAVPGDAVPIPELVVSHVLGRPLG